MSLNTIVIQNSTSLCTTLTFYRDSSSIVFVALTDECKQLGSQGLIMISYMKEKSASTVEQIQAVKKQLGKISNLADSLSKALGNVEVIGDLVENELSSMDKAIEEAAARIQVKKFQWILFQLLMFVNYVEFHCSLKYSETFSTALIAIYRGNKIIG